MAGKGGDSKSGKGKGGKGGKGDSKYEITDVVAVILKRPVAIDLLNALVLALGVMPPGKKKAKGKKKGKGGKPDPKPKPKTAVLFQ